jgi:hypothetical protein
MDTLDSHSKEKVRKYLEQRRGTHLPPPSMDEIRRQLGWTDAGTAASKECAPDTCKDARGPC